MTPTFDLWRLASLPSRVSVVEPSGVVVPVSSGAIGVSGVRVPPLAAPCCSPSRPAAGRRPSTATR